MKIGWKVYDKWNDTMRINKTFKKQFIIFNFKKDKIKNYFKALKDDFQMAQIW